MAAELWFQLLCELAEADDDNGSMMVEGYQVVYHQIYDLAMIAYDCEDAESPDE